MKPSKCPAKEKQNQKKGWGRKKKKKKTERRGKEKKRKEKVEILEILLCAHARTSEADRYFASGTEVRVVHDRQTAFW